MNHFFTRKVRTRQSLIHKLAGTILLLLLFTKAFSQKESGIFLSDDPFSPQKTGNIFLSFDNLNFFKNNEYKSNYVDGYTLTGTWIRPKLLFYPDKKFRFELGAQVLAYNGKDDYKVYPWFAAVYKPYKQITFRMGNLNQDQNHGLPEPIFDCEHFFNERPESGIQVKIEEKKWNVDLWIDWQKMIFKGDPYKERFVFGTAGGVTLLQNEKRKLQIPIVFNGVHEGGEIDNAPGEVKTHIVVSEGLKYEYNTGGSLVKSGRLEFSFLQSTYPLHETALPGKSGIGIFIQTAMNTDYGTFGSGYWQGNRFFTPLGMPLYQNGAIDQEKATAINRLFVFSYRFDHKIFDKSRFGFVSDLFLNPATQKLSNSAALYLMINFEVLFKKSNL
jgi:hypothetical protein